MVATQVFPIADHYMDMLKKNSRTILYGLDPYKDVPKRSSVWPIPLKYFEKLQQAEFWSHQVQSVGAEAIQYTRDIEKGSNGSGYL